MFVNIAPLALGRFVIYSLVQFREFQHAIVTVTRCLIKRAKFSWTIEI